ncbi:MAG: hypothetical protein JWR69_1809 [Pedosphaera sp.]|nr:hypothetical protein [Pedosphaera sp.]
MVYENGSVWTVRSRMFKPNLSIRNEVRWIAFSWALVGMLVCFNFFWHSKEEILAGQLPDSLGLYLSLALAASGFGVFKRIRVALLPLLILLSQSITEATELGNSP